MEYNFKEIEKRWQEYWVKNNTYKVVEDASKPKFYVLDMFPYPSGAGLHVGHPLGYIASDIYSRYKRSSGFNVLHPMGYDAYGLPAEQYAIQTGQHPSITTEQNINRYREQLDKIGFSFDWSREIRTCEPEYYKWTQWAFIKMFNSFYCNEDQEAQPIEELIKIFEASGTKGLNVACSETLEFTAEEWKAKSEKEQQEILLNYRIAYLGETMVNWCSALGTVLANDEVINGLSERGGHPVEQRKMRQWCLRVSAYAPRLLDGLETVDWSDSIKETQKNWIGRSEGAEMRFKVKDADLELEIFTTRADTVFGVTFMVLAPESDYVQMLTTDAQKSEVEAYLTATKKRTERERQADKKISGVFSGSYAVNPLNGKEIPIWIADYVLAGYGTGAIMAVPAHDSRDYAFAKHFDLPIIPLVEGCDISESSYDAKEGIVTNSDFLNGLSVKEAIAKAKEYIEEKKLGHVKTNYRLRDATFSRQRYWGEPFPVYYKDGMPYMLPIESLPLELPEVDKFLPTETGEPPLGRATNWAWNTEKNELAATSAINNTTIFPLEFNTMPGFAGSSAYYLRYMDPHNDKALLSEESAEYWGNVDLYIGGTEHATGHLIYSRFWNKFLYDIKVSREDEPYKKLINQGMIQGRSNFVYRINNSKYAEKLLGDKITDLGFIYSDNNFDFEHEKKPIYLGITSGDPKRRSLLEDIAVTRGYRAIFITPADIIENISGTVAEISNFLDSDSYFLDILKEKAKPYFVSLNLKDQYETTQLHVDVNIVSNDILDTDKFKAWRPEFATAEFILEDDKYICGATVEKMSKSYHNVVNPDDIADKYGADTLRLYEMFLGPLELSKPWDTNGIDGVFRFLRKLWNLFYKDETFTVTDGEPTKEELKSLHKLIKKVTSDIENFSFNTSVSASMICVNELTSLKCNNRTILSELITLLAPFAPHIAEELWNALGNNTSISDAKWPICNESYLVEDVVNYTISFNGKARFTIEFSATATNEEIEKTVFAHANTDKWLEGKTPKKVIIVPKKIVNIVL